MLFSSYAESNEDNAEFARALLKFLRQHEIETEGATGAVLVVMLEDGFDVLQLSEQAMSDGQLSLYMQHVAEHMKQAMARLN